MGMPNFEFTFPTDSASNQLLDPENAPKGTNKCISARKHTNHNCLNNRMAEGCENLPQAVLFALAITGVVSALAFIILFICNFVTGDKVFKIPMYASLGVAIASALTYGLFYVGLNAHFLCRNSYGNENDQENQYSPHAGPSGNSEQPQSSAVRTNKLTTS
nr:hypothetical protein HmN_000862000 [Hymenolepis microstoma]